MSTSTIPYQPLTLEEVVAGEPRVLDLLADARNVARLSQYDRTFCRERVWKHGYASYEGFKPRLLDLVGWESPHKGTRLGKGAAWDLVVDRLMEILPACRDCG